MCMLDLMFLLSASQAEMLQLICFFPYIVKIILQVLNVIKITVMVTITYYKHNRVPKIHKRVVL